MSHKFDTVVDRSFIPWRNICLHIWSHKECTWYNTENGTDWKQITCCICEKGGSIHEKWFFLEACDPNKNWFRFGCSKYLTISWSSDRLHFFEKFCFFLERKFRVYIHINFWHAPGRECPSGEVDSSEGKDPGFDSHQAQKFRWYSQSWLVLWEFTKPEKKPSSCQSVPLREFLWSLLCH